MDAGGRERGAAVKERRVEEEQRGGEDEGEPEEGDGSEGHSGEGVEEEEHPGKVDVGGRNTGKGSEAPEEEGALKATRRQILGALPLVALAGAVGGGIVGAELAGPPGRSRPTRLPGGLPEIPDAAWERPLGDHPPGASGAMAQEGFQPQSGQSMTKRGIPVGGIGTGSFMVNLCGTFGPWNMAIGGDDSAGTAWGYPKNSGFEHRFLSQAAFFVRIARLGTGAGYSGDPLSGRKIFGTALATEDVLEGWPRLAAGQGTYKALFPKAWFSFDSLPLPVMLKQVTPYVARDYRTSSLPAGLFDLTAWNPFDEPVEVSFMFSFPNAPYRMPTESYTYTRTGLSSIAVQSGLIAGIRLQANSPSNVDVTQQTEWVIAATGGASEGIGAAPEVTYATNWNGNGNGSDLWEHFMSAGRLPNGSLYDTEPGLAGAVAVRLVIEPGRTGTAYFALTWDFPIIQFKNPVAGTKWWKRYKEFYPGHLRGWDIATDLLSIPGAVEEAVDAWWRPIAHDNAYPDWVRCAGLNELYYDVFGGVFWESGCISKTKVYGNRPGQHLYFSMESDQFRDCESFDVRHYESIHSLQLFPEIERDLLLGWADMIMADAAGRTPHDAGSPINDPWFAYDQYYAVWPGSTVSVPVDWYDLPPKFVLQCHAYWAYTGDIEFLAEAYPACRRTMEHVMSFDYDGDGIPDAMGPVSGYDVVPFMGANLYIAVLIIGAQEGLTAMAQALGHMKDAASFSLAGSKARATTDRLLWNPRLGYYMMQSEGADKDSLMSDGLLGQRMVETSGLADALPRHRMVSHLKQVYRRAVKPFGGGRFGAVNIVSADGEPLDIADETAGVWPGASYVTAALMCSAAKLTQDTRLMSEGLATGHGVYRTTYVDDATAFWFAVPALWLPGRSEEVAGWRTPTYMRNRAAWELLVSLKDPFPPGGGAGASGA